MKSFEAPDNHYLRAAQGWLELGNPLEADKELEHITPQLLTHPDVLEVRWHISALKKEWITCLDIARTLLKLDPDRPDAWIHRSFALHELKRTQEAFDQLLGASERFSEVWTIPYNLACYCAQIGKLEECRAWLNKAMAIDEETVKRVAAEDPDLKPFWDNEEGRP
jgi:tetratricopeptide (TPR) repeat protein